MIPRLKGMDKIIVLGKIWKSETNGAVYSPEGISPTLTVGAHSGVSPKILLYEEKDTRPVPDP